MVAAIKSEILKLFTIRSTYVIFLIAMGFNVLFSFYIIGWQSDAESLLSPTIMSSQFASAVSALGLFIGLIAVLLMTHEYRYNTISYTLTSNKSRTTVLFSKFLVASVFAIIASLLFGFIALGLSYLAVHVRGLELAPQNIDYWNIIWRSALVGWGYAAFGLIIAAIIRVQVGAIAAMFLLPSTVEQLLGLLLKKNQVYLPYTALNNVFDAQFGGTDPAVPTKAAVTVLLYLVVGFAISAVLFLRRDAN